MKDMMRLFGTLFAYTTVFIAVMGVINIVFDLNLSMGKYGSYMPLPTEFSELGFLVAALLIFAGLLWLAGSVGDLFRTIKRKPVAAFGILVALSAFLVVGGNFALTWFLGGPLMRAIEMGNPQQAQVILHENSYESAALRDPLYFSLQREYYPLAESVLAAGADANHVDDNEFETSILQSSVLHFGPEAVEILLKNGADPNVQDTLGRTAMVITVTYRGDRFPAEDPVRVLKALHKAGADLSIADNKGNTVSAIAEKENNTPVLDYLAQLSTSDETAIAKP